MCGIVAIANRDPQAPVSADALRGMARTLVHRGPEDEGVLARGGGGLGLRRLSFMDIPGGQQPFRTKPATSMWSATARSTTIPRYAPSW